MSMDSQIDWASKHYMMCMPSELQHNGRKNVNLPSVNSVMHLQVYMPAVGVVCTCFIWLDSNIIEYAMIYIWLIYMHNGSLVLRNRGIKWFVDLVLCGRCIYKNMNHFRSTWSSLSLSVYMTIEISICANCFSIIKIIILVYINHLV